MKWGKDRFIRKLEPHLNKESGRSCADRFFFWRLSHEAEMGISEIALI